MLPSYYAIVIRDDDEDTKEAILCGAKTFTVLCGTTDYNSGLAYICCETLPWSVRVMVVAVKHRKFYDISDEECTAAGYKSKQEMLVALKKQFSNLEHDSRVTTLKWRDVSGKLVDDYKRLA